MSKFYKKMHDSHSNANANLELSPVGNGGYDLHPDTLLPVMKKPQSVAQHESVKKAAKASVMKRKIAAGKLYSGSKSGF